MRFTAQRQYITQCQVSCPSRQKLKLTVFYIEAHLQHSAIPLSVLLHVADAAHLVTHLRETNHYEIIVL